MFGLGRKQDVNEAATEAVRALEVASEALAAAKDAMEAAQVREFRDLRDGTLHARTEVDVLYTLAGKVLDRLEDEQRAGGER
ncbi:hypothetical protein [Myceligenerans xiligouense]|uniref:Uncharacterized protein n=1 Tax=Myceligenerans xiligouense TaxID=253184 RepID=A0A3N4YPK2_9MICO|nr:hypothetical protein [Myceligenerans xiligouense]RPF21294.1 hypothetical protein EDD34_1919 [Myceligenerans xiligouense]